MKWIHLSDIHFDPQNDGRNANQLRKKLFEYIKEHHIKADYLFITGDFRYAKNQKEREDEILYNTVKFILNIADVAQVPYSNIYIVPGNHDLQRTKNNSRIEKIVNNYTVQDGRFKQNDLNFLLERFGFYKKLILEFKKQGVILPYSSTLLPLHTVHCFDEFNLLSLNTCIACNSDTDRGNLILGNYDLYNALESIGKNAEKPIIIIAHHGLDNFRIDEKRTIEQIFKDYPIRLYLCGDAHNFWQRDVNNILEITMGCLTYGETVRMTFSTGELVHNEYSVEAHEWNADLYKWGQCTQFNEQLCRWPLSKSVNYIRLYKKMQYYVWRIFSLIKKFIKKNKRKCIISTCIIVLTLICVHLFTNDNIKLLLEGNNKFAFILEDDFYELPTSYQTFVKNGWNLSPLYYYKETDELNSNQLISVPMCKDNTNIKVIIMNTTDNTLPLNKCMVGGISVCQYKREYSDNVNFEMVKGMNGLSSVYNMQELFGEPTEKDFYGTTKYLIYNTEDEIKFFYFESSYDSVNGELLSNRIELRNLEGINYVTPRSYFDKSGYEVPLNLGTQLDSNVIEIDGKLYRFPCPLSEFLDDGWTLDQPTNSNDSDYAILNGNNETCGWNLEKNGKYIVVRLRNYSDQALFLPQDNVAVDYIYIGRSELEESLIKLPCGLTENSSLSEIDEILSYIQNDTEGSVNYEKNMSYRYNSLDVSVSISSDYVTITYDISGYLCHSFTFEGKPRYDE